MFYYSFLSTVTVVMIYYQFLSTLFLHSMPADCYFNIVGFGSTFQFLFKESVKYDDASLNKAIQHSNGLNADLGGTEILSPLEAIFSKPQIPGYFRQIFVLTDGQVSNTEGVIRICKANADKSRVFALGIGDGASHHLVEGMAEAGGGTAAFVTYNEAIDPKVLQQLKNAIQPSLTNVVLKWTGLPEISAPIEINKEKTLLGYGTPISTISTAEIPKKKYWQAPEKINPIFDGAQLVVLGIFEGTDVPSGVEIVAESPDGPLSIQIQLSENNDVGSTGMVHKLAAIKTLKELEMKMRDSALIEEEELKKQIIRLGCQHGLASSLTSFVAVHTSKETLQVTSSDDIRIMQSRYVPSQVANGWHNQFRRCHVIRSLGSANHYGPIDGGLSDEILLGDGCRTLSATSGMSFAFSNPFSKLFTKIGQAFSSKQGMAPRMNTFSSNNKRKEEEPDEEEDSLQALVAKQSFKGSFSLDQGFCDVIGKLMNLVLEEAKSGGWTEDAWATALAIAYMNHELSESKESWELVEIKARKWLKENFEQEMDVILASAQEFLKNK